MRIDTLAKNIMKGCLISSITIGSFFPISQMIQADDSVEYWEGDENENENEKTDGGAVQYWEGDASSSNKASESTTKPDVVQPDKKIQNTMPKEEAGSEKTTKTSILIMTDGPGTFRFPTNFSPLDFAQLRVIGGLNNRDINEIFTKAKNLELLNLSEAEFIDPVFNVQAQSLSKLKHIDLPQKELTRKYSLPAGFATNHPALVYADLSGVSNIGDKAFENIKTMERIILPKITYSVGAYAFENTNGLVYYDDRVKTSVLDLSNVVSIGYHAFGIFDVGLIRFGGPIKPAIASNAFSGLPPTKLIYPNRWGDGFKVEVGPSMMFPSISEGATVVKQGSKWVVSVDSLLNNDLSDRPLQVYKDGEYVTTATNVKDNVFTIESMGSADFGTYTFSKNYNLRTDIPLLTGPDSVNEYNFGSITVLEARLQINTTQDIIDVGNTLNLTVAANYPEIKDLEWRSHNSDIASVDSSGKVIAKKEGMVMIEVRDKSNGESDMKMIEVVDTLSTAHIPKDLNLNDKIVIAMNTTDLERWSWDKEYFKLDETKNYKLTAIKAGEGKLTIRNSSGKEKSIMVTIRSLAIEKHETLLGLGNTLELKTVKSHDDLKELQWSSSDSSVARVDSNGVVTPVGKGKATITVTDAKYMTTTSTKIEVVDTLYISGIPENLNLNDKIQPKATLQPSTSVGDQGWTYDAKFFSKKKNGSLEAIKVGKTTITFTAIDGRSVSVDVTIRSLSIKKHPAYVEVGGSLTLKYTKSYDDVANIAWSSSNPDAVSINNKGKLKVKEAAEVTLTVEDLNHNTKAVTKIKAIPVLELQDIPEVIALHGKFTPKTTYQAEAGKTGYTFDSRYLRMDQGVMTALKAGTTTITYKDEVGREVSKTIVIRSFTFKAHKDYLELEKTMKLELSTSDTTLTNVTWESDAEHVATVDQNGNVTAVGVGFVSISATDEATNMTIQTTLEVVGPLTVSNVPSSMNVGDTFIPETSHKAESGKTGWSYDKSFFNVDATTNTFTALAIGTASVTYTDYLGREVKKDIIIRSLSFEKTPKHIEIGTPFKYVLDKSNSDMTNIVWKSSNPAIATVNANGKVVGITEGMVTIQASDVDFKTTISTDVQIVKPLVLTGIPTNVNVGDTFTPKASHKKAEGTKGLVWNTNFFTQDKNKGGELKAIKAGTTTITFTDYLGREVKQEVIVRSLAIKKHVPYVEVGAKNKLVLQLEASNKDMKKFVWSSSDESIATIGADGEVTGIAPGTVTITVQDSVHQTIATTTIDVERKLVLSGIPTNVNVGDTFTPKASHKKAEGTKGLVWDTNFFTQDKNKGGELKAIKAGTTTISFTDYLGREVKQEVIVRSLEIKKHVPYVEVGAEKKLALQLETSNTDMKNFVWSSSDETIAKVSADGRITGVKAGSAEITVVDTEHGTTAKTVIQVEIKLVLSNIPANVNVGDMFTPKASHKEADGTKGMVWDTEFFTQNREGKLKATKAGTTTITFTDYLGREVKQEVIVRSLAIKKHVPYVEVGAEKKLALQLETSNADMKNFTWTSSDETIAKVNADGRITGVKSGSVEITVVDTEHGTTAKTVIQVETKLVLDGIPKHVNYGDSFTPKASHKKADGKKGMVWDAKFFTQNREGELNAIKVGTTTISFTDYLGRRVEQEITIRSLSIKEHTKYIEIGAEKRLALQLETSNKDMKKFEWSSSNTTIAKVSADGRVTGVKPGKVDIIVVDIDHNTTAKTTIEVVEKLSIKNIPANVNLGDKFVPKGSHQKGDVKKALRWDKEYFTQDKNKGGEFVAIKTGETKISYTDYLGRMVTYNVIIRDLEVTASKNYVEIGENKDLRLKLKLSHEDMRSFEWKSDNEDLAVVDSQGVVTGRTEGIVQISAKDKEHGTTKSMKLIVVKPLTLSGIPSKVVVGQKFTVTPSYDKAEQKDAGWKWDTTLFTATFNSPATFTALKADTAIITFEDVLGRKISARFTVHPATTEGGGLPSTPAGKVDGAASLAVPGSSGGSKGVNTGDETNMNVLLSLLLVSMGGVGYFYRKKKTSI